MSKINLFLWLLVSFAIVVGTLWVLINRPKLRQDLRNTLAPVTIKLDAKDIQVGDLLAHPVSTITPKKNTELWLKKDFVEESAFGLLPKRNAINEPVYLAYNASPVAKNNKTSLTILVINLGYDKLSQGWALHLPYQVSLSYSPYADDLQNLISEARGFEHEVFLTLPISSSKNSPVINDSGPLSLNFKSSDKLKQTLLQVLAQSTGYIGLHGNLAKLTATQQDSVAKVLGEFKKRGLLYVDKDAKSTASLTKLYGTSEYRPIANIMINSTEMNPQQMQVAYDFIMKSIEKKKNQSIVWIVPAIQSNLIALSNLISKSNNMPYTLIPFSQLAHQQ